MTLVEVLVSAAILAILMGGMASAVALAARAIPKSGANASAAQVQASVAEAMEQMNADLMCAKTITELTANAITMTVADRGHGAAGDETIRYAWSGVAGATLTREYNGGAAATIVDNVASYVLAETKGAGKLQSPPRVMLVVGNSGSLSTNDAARVALLTQWGFPTTVVDDAATAAEYAAAAIACDVAWYGSEASSITMYGRLPNPSVGVVVEKNTLLNEFGLASFPAQVSEQKITILDVSHEITSGFVLGQIDVVMTAQYLLYATGTRAPDGRVLAGRIGSTGDPTLMVIDVGGRTWNNQVSRSRRVQLPWGGNLVTPLPISALTNDARWLLRKSLVWAAAPVVYSRVSVGITAGRASTVTRTIDLLNQPGVPKP